MYAIGKPYAVLWQQRFDLYGWSLPIAKGFGQANKVIFAVILLPGKCDAVIAIVCVYDMIACLLHFPGCLSTRV